jgi:hypothetical protein
MTNGMEGMGWAMSLIDLTRRAPARCLVGMDVTLIDASRDQRIALKVHRLAVVGRRHRHVRQTPSPVFPYGCAKRQGLLC